MLFAKCKKVFFGLFFVFLVILFFFVFLCLCFVKSYFPAILEFFYFVPLKGLSLKSFFSSYSVFFFWLSFCLLLQNTISSLLFVVINPFFLENIIIFCFFIVVLPFPFLMFACFFETNFPNIPVFYPGCLHLWLVIFLQSFLFLFPWCMFLPLCFYVGFALVILFF